MSLDLRRAADRFRTRSEGRETWHSFAFGAHYDPTNTGFGGLSALNDEHLPPGTGYGAHRHTETEIVTVVLSGSLHHVSSVGEATLGPGDVQRLTAGTGVVHAETSADADGVTRFVQTWLRPAAPGLEPSYQLVRGALRECEGTLSALDLGTAGTGRLHLGRLAPGGRVALPHGDPRHLMVASGEGTVSCDDDPAAVRLGAGDAVRLAGTDRVSLRAGSPLVALFWATA